MAEHNMHNFSLSNNTSSDDSLERLPPFTTGCVNPTGASSSQQPPPPTTTIPVPPAASKKPRGRPPGSKNKPKPPLVITQDNEQTMKPVMIEVSPGTDVIEALTQFAICRRSIITIMNCSGTVKTATIHCPLSPTPDFTLHGPFSIMQLSGSYVPPASPPYPLSLISSPNPNPPPPPTPQPFTFSITLAGMQGQVFGGLVGGRIIAGGAGVKLMTTLYRNPELHRVGGIVVVNEGDDDEDDDEDDDQPNFGDPGAGPSGVGGGDMGNENMSGGGGFNAMNFQGPSDPSFMQWIHPHPPPNY